MSVQFACICTWMELIHFNYKTAYFSKSSVRTHIYVPVSGVYWVP